MEQPNPTIPRWDQVTVYTPDDDRGVRDLAYICTRLPALQLRCYILRQLT